MSEMKTYGDPTSATTAYVGLVGTIIFIQVVIFIQVLYYRAEMLQEQEKVVEVTAPELLRYRQVQREVLGGYHFEAEFEGEGERISIPIEEGMRLFLRERGNRASAASTGHDPTNSSSQDNGAPRREESDAP